MEERQKEKNNKLKRNNKKNIIQSLIFTIFFSLITFFEYNLISIFFLLISVLFTIIYIFKYINKS